MTEAIETFDLGRKYGVHWALRGCTFSIPAGRIAGLVGPNGAGKTTLMHMLVGLLTPTSGSAKIFGLSPEKQLDGVLSMVGFVGQDRPLYRTFTVCEMLRFGRELNRRWDDTLALQRIKELDIPLDRPTGKLSGGQQAQVALLLALAKRPSLLILDEPLASLDPLARHQFMQILMDSAAQDEQTILISSHQITDLERICDSLVLLSQSRLLLAGDLADLLNTHRWVTCPPDGVERLANLYRVVRVIQTNRSSRLMVRIDRQNEPNDSEGNMENVTLEELILAYLSFSKNECELFYFENSFQGVIP
jgi:ABC-2 type transport system ATP-binding protein